MTASKTSVCFISTPSPKFERSCSTHLSSSNKNPPFNEALSSLGLNSILQNQSQIPPIRRLSTREFPRLPSIASFDSEAGSSQPRCFPQLRGRTSSNLRASIAKLELLIHEAARLAEVAAQQETAIEPGGSRAQEDKCTRTLEAACDSLYQAKRIGKTVPRGSTSPNASWTMKPRDPRPSSRAVSSLPVAKAVPAAPVLTLPTSPSVDDVRWIPRTPFSQGVKEVDVHT